MKNLFIVIAISAIMFSCSNNIDDINVDDTINERLDPVDFKQIIEEKYDGEILTFENEKDFISFYNLLSSLDQSDFQDFLRIKDGNNSSLFRNLSEEVEKEMETNNNKILEVKNSEKLFVSEYFSTIFNYDNEVIIAKKTVSITESGDLLSHDRDENKLSVLGNIINYNNQNLAKRSGANSSQSWGLSTGRGRRVILTFFNETIYINNQVSSSKVFYRIHQQRESCSFWRCTWKDDGAQAFVQPSLTSFNGCNWNNTIRNNNFSINTALVTINIADYTPRVPCIDQPYLVSGSLSYVKNNNTFVFSNLSYTFDPF